MGWVPSWVSSPLVVVAPASGGGAPVLLLLSVVVCMYLKSFVSNRKNEIENKIKTYIGPKKHRRHLLGLLFSSPSFHLVSQALLHTHQPHKQLRMAVVGVLHHHHATCNPPYEQWLIGLGRVPSHSSSFMFTWFVCSCMRQWFWVLIVVNSTS